MDKIYIGTAYHQIYSLSLSKSLPLTKYNQKKKIPITSIYYSQQQNTINFSNPYQIFQLKQSSNQIIHSQQFIKHVTQNQSNQKIIKYQGCHDIKIICTSYGDIYSKTIQSDQLPTHPSSNKWTKLHTNDTTRTIMTSTPKKPGMQLPAYSQACIQQNIDQIKIACVGKSVLPFVYSFAHKPMLWQAKNVANDYLDLQIPPNDVDCCFINKNYHLVVAHAQNKIRIYDIQSRRRKPISDITLTQILKTQQSSLSKITKSLCQKYLYISNHHGSIYQLDLRKNCQMISKIKNINTTIKDIKMFQSYLTVISLDGYLRIFNTINQNMEVQKYLNIHPQIIMLYPEKIKFNSQGKEKNQGILVNDNKQQNQQQQQQHNKKITKIKKIRKRNKVGLKYLQVSPNITDLTLQNNKKQQNYQIQQQQIKQQINNNLNQQIDQDLDL